MDGKMKDNDSKFELITKYFEGRLNTTEKRVFDQLLASDQEFAQDVSDYRQVTAFTDFLDEEILLKDIDITNRQIEQSKLTNKQHQLVANAPINQKDQRAIVRPVFLPHNVSNRYAAAIVLLLVSMVVVSLMFSSLDLSKQTAVRVPKVLKVEHVRKLGNKPSNVPEKHDDVLATNQSKKTKAEPAFLAANFEVNETFEKHIQEYAHVLKDRSSHQAILKFEIIQPQKTVSNQMAIQWRSDKSLENITVKVYNNKNRQVLQTYDFPSKSGKTKLITATLIPGLYYWRVMNTETEEVLFVGKFTKKN